MSPDIVKKMEQLSEEIIHKLEEFIRNEQAFSQDFYISATEPLLQLEDLLDYCRSYLPHHLDLIERTEQERNRLFEWAHIANKINDAEAKGKTKGFAERLVKKLQHISEIVRDELASEKLTGTGQEIANAFMSAADLAKHYGVDTESLRKRLDRQREKHTLDTNLFIESQDRGKNKPKYLYNAKMVLHIIKKLKSKEASVKRPSEKK